MAHELIEVLSQLNFFISISKYRPYYLILLQPGLALQQFFCTQFPTTPRFGYIQTKVDKGGLAGADCGCQIYGQCAYNGIARLDVFNIQMSNLPIYGNALLPCPFDGTGVA